MKVGESITLKSRFEDTETEKIFSEMTKILAKRNSVRIIVNATGAFPVQASTQPWPIISWIPRRILFSLRYHRNK